MKEPKLKLAASSSPSAETADASRSASSSPSSAGPQSTAPVSASSHQQLHVTPLSSSSSASLFQHKQPPQPAHKLQPIRQLSPAELEVTTSAVTTSSSPSSSSPSSSVTMTTGSSPSVSKPSIAQFHASKFTTANFTETTISPSAPKNKPGRPAQPKNPTSFAGLIANNVDKLAGAVSATTAEAAFRYKTTVSSAREKASIRLCAQKRTWHDLIGCYSHINNGG